MAKHQPLSGAEARAILANAASHGVDWRPAKPVSEYSDATARRYAGNILAGKAPDRGHAHTPEHGTRRTVVNGQEVIVARNPSDAAKARAQARVQGKHAPVLPSRVVQAREAAGRRVVGQEAPGVSKLANGALSVHGSSKAQARFAARYAKSLSEEGERGITGAKRVQVVVYDKNGGKHLMGRKGGMNPKDLQNALKGRGTIAGALAGLAGSIYEHNDMELDWEPSGEFDILIV